jgi:FKBP-type peptidyl-prolyl cis-trans isomerase FklB
MYRLALLFSSILLGTHMVVAQRLASTWDSVCYALGVTWRHDLLQHHMRVSVVPFSKGIVAYYHNDTATFSLKNAYDFIDRHEKDFTHDSLSPILRDSLSFAVGLAWGRNIYAAGIPCPDASLLRSGMQADSSILMTTAAAKKLLSQYLEKLREEEYRGIKLMNEQWLEANTTKEGVVVLPSGVQYRVIDLPSSERRPSDTSIFVLSYKAMLIDGTVFEQSSRPEKFYLSALIPGLHQVLLSMRVGEKREVYIPYYHAFGTGGVKNKVPPFATVIYEIELVDVE